MKRKQIAIFGGSFDPIHNGHLKTSLQIQAEFHFDEYLFLPCNKPVLKPKTIASNEDRIAMLQLALKPYPQFKLDLREIKSDAPSYMVNTLDSIKKEHPEDNLSLIIGFDAFQSLNQWHQWEKILERANLLVMKRSHSTHHTLNPVLSACLNTQETQDKKEFLDARAGKIFITDAGQYDLSSTRIRAALKVAKVLTSELPALVLAYIQKHHLYS